MEQLLLGWTFIWDSQVSSQWNRSTLWPGTHSRGGIGRIGLPPASLQYPEKPGPLLPTKELDNQGLGGQLSEMQSPGIEEDVEFSRSSSSTLLEATPSAVPLFRTVQIIDRAGQLRPLRAEVARSLCTIISRAFLDMHLPKMPMDPLRKLPSSCGVNPFALWKGPWASGPVLGIGW